MKTTFKQYLQEAAMPKAESEEDLLASIKNGKFTLDGSELKIYGYFDCHNDNLTSLVGAPASVSLDFFCQDNKLTSLEGAPASILRDLNCSHNQLTSLKGGPTSVGRDFICHNNKLTSLKDIHKHISSIGGKAYFKVNPIKSHVLGLLKIKSLQRALLDNGEVQAIINKYLPEGDIFACQQELIDAGFEEYAQL